LPRCPPMAVKNTLNNVTSCYTFHATPMTWTEAYDVCRREGPHSALVSVETEAEQRFLVSHIKQDTALSVVGQNGFYTSGSDVGNEHSFKWTDTGIPRPVTWSAGWHAGQPNNEGGNQNCLLMQYPADDYKWGDIECDSKHPFICEVYYQV
ncbi:hemolymph lipopolysaccharide-binding protein, partial [Biomphalaria glabrata]